MSLQKLKLSLPVLVAVLFLAVLACSSADNLPNPFASPTPTATVTFTPTPTATPTPTSTPKATPLPSGLQLEARAGEATLVRDWDNGYEMTLPGNWALIQLNAQDLGAMIQRSATADPQFGEVAGAFAEMDPDTVRLIGLDKNPKYIKAKYPTMLVLMALQDKLAGSMPMEFVTAMIEDGALKGSTDTAWDVKHNPHGVDVGIVTGTLKAIIPNSPKQIVAVRVIAFQAAGKLIMLEVMTPVQFRDEVLPATDVVIDGIQLDKH